MPFLLTREHRFQIPAGLLTHGSSAKTPSRMTSVAHCLLVPNYSKGSCGGFTPLFPFQSVSAHRDPIQLSIASWQIVCRPHYISKPHLAQSVFLTVF